MAKRLAESFAEDEEIAPFDREFSLALDLSFDHSDHGEVSEAPLAGKAPVTFEPVDLVADGVSSGFNPTMIALEAVAALAGIGLWVREEAFDLGAQGRPVVFEGEQIVRPLIADCPCDLGLAAHGVGGDKGSTQFQALQQSGDGGDLVGFLPVGLPAEHQALARGPGGDQVQRVAALGPVMAAPGGLTVDGDDIGIGVAQLVDPCCPVILYSMRTTLNIEDKALAIVKTHAAQTYQSVGQVISQMVYDAAGIGYGAAKRNGVPLFDVVSHESSPDIELVNALCDE